MPPKKRLSKKLLIIIALIITIVGGYLYSQRNKNGFPPKTALVERRNIEDTIELSGEVTAENYAELHFPAGGFVTYYPWQEGDEIKKFSTIASLDQRQLKKTLEKYLNTYAKERNDFDISQDTYETEKELGNLEPDIRRALEAAQYDLTNSVLDVELQDLTVRLSRLTSPIDGILVSSPIATPNVYVGITDSWYVVDPSSLTFTADLDESDLWRVEPGQSATIELDAFPDWVLETQVERIAYQSKLTTTGTIFEVTFHLPAEHLNELRLGLNGNVSILREVHENVLTIPVEAVKEALTGPTVTVKENGKAVEKEVKLGVSDDSYYQILEGLTDGQEIYYGK